MSTSQSDVTGWTWSTNHCDIEYSMKQFHRNCCQQQAQCRQPVRACVGVSCHKYHFCRDKHVLWQQIFVAANIILSWHAYLCRDKTRLLSRQKYACCDQTSATKKLFCHDNGLVTTSILLSPQKMCIVATNTRMILVASPASDKGLCWPTLLPATAVHVLKNTQTHTQTQQAAAAAASALQQVWPLPTICRHDQIWRWPFPSCMLMVRVGTAISF